MSIKILVIKLRYASVRVFLMKIYGCGEFIFRITIGAGWQQLRMYKTKKCFKNTLIIPLTSCLQSKLTWWNKSQSPQSSFLFLFKILNTIQANIFGSIPKGVKETLGTIIITIIVSMASLHRIIIRTTNCICIMCHLQQKRPVSLMTLKRNTVTYIHLNCSVDILYFLMAMRQRKKNVLYVYYTRRS